MMQSEFITTWLDSRLGLHASAATAVHPERGEETTLKALLFENSPSEDVVTLCTAGLSETIFSLPDQVPCRQEFLLTCSKEQLSDAHFQLLFILAAFQRERGEAMLAGNVLDLEGELIEGSSLCGFLFWTPVSHPEMIQDGIPGHTPTFFLWAIPLTAGELRFVEQEGANAFDRVLVAAKPDLNDWFRESVL